ncbi:MAG: response regulator [FCB group bacterium]|jgi:two-component system KDP operon response regulator KdpE
MSNKIKILVIDDEPQIRKFLRISLESHSYQIIEAETGKDGLVQAAMNHPDIIILDLGLPDEDGLNILKQLREWSSIPVIVLSVRNSEQDKIMALDNGADDFVTKPFSVGELLARLRAALRHTLPVTESAIFKTGRMSVDLVSRTVKVNDETIKLTATEYSIIKLFVVNAGKVLTHKYLLKEIWGNTFAEDTQYLRVFMAQIRKKVEENPSNPKLFVTESGVGYRLNIIE